VAGSDRMAVLASVRFFSRNQDESGEKTQKVLLTHDTKGVCKTKSEQERKEIFSFS